MTRKECRVGKKRRIQQLLKGLANIRPEPMKLDLLKIQQSTNSKGY